MKIQFIRGGMDRSLQNSGRPAIGQNRNGQGNSHGNGQGNSHGNCQGNSHGNDQGNSHGNCQGNSHGNGQGNSHGNGQGNSHGNGQGNSHGNGQGNSHGNSQGNSHGNSQGNPVNGQRSSGPQRGNQRNQRNFNRRVNNSNISVNYYAGEPLHITNQNGGQPLGGTRGISVRNPAPNLQQLRPPFHPTLQYPAQPGVGLAPLNNQYGNPMPINSTGIPSGLGGSVYQYPRGQPHGIGPYPVWTAPMRRSQQPNEQPQTMGPSTVNTDHTRKNQHSYRHPLSMGPNPMQAGPPPMGLQLIVANGSVAMRMVPPGLLPPGMVAIGWGPPGIDPRRMVVPRMMLPARVPSGMVQPGTALLGNNGNGSASDSSHRNGAGALGNPTSGSAFISNNFGGSVSVANSHYYLHPHTQTPGRVAIGDTSEMYPLDGGASSSNKQRHDGPAPTPGYAPSTSATQNITTQWAPSPARQPRMYPPNQPQTGNVYQEPTPSFENPSVGQTIQPDEPILTDVNVENYRKYFTQLQKQKKQYQDSQQPSLEDYMSGEDFIHTTSAEKAADFFGKDNVRTGIFQTGHPYYLPPVTETFPDGQTQVVFQRTNGSKQAYLTDGENLPAITDRYHNVHRREMEAAISEGSYKLPDLPDDSALDHCDGVEQHQAEKEEKQQGHFVRQVQLHEASDNGYKRLVTQLQQLNVASDDVRQQQS